MWWFLQMVANFLRCCLNFDVLQQKYSQFYSLLSYFMGYLGACIVFYVFCVCVWVCLCVNWAIKCIAFDLGEALTRRCMPRCERLWMQLIVTMPGDFVAAPCCWATPPSLALLPFEGREVSFLFPTDSSIIGPLWWLTKHLWFPPGPKFRAPSRLLLKITDYLSLLPILLGTDGRTTGVPVPVFCWKA